MVGEGKVFDKLTVGDLEVSGDVIGDAHITTNGNGKFMRLDFSSEPIAMSVLDGGARVYGAPVGATGDENMLQWPEGSLEYHILGTQTILAPVPVATGLNIGMDQTDNDGVELCAGILASNKLAFTVGTDAAFYAKMRFSIATVAGTDDCVFGFRKVEAYQANVDDYDEMAALNVNAGNILNQTILNGGDTDATDTTNNWADAGIHEITVLVSAAGVVTYKIDGVAPLVATAFTFDTGEVVVPFMFMLQANAAQTGALVLEHFECGYQ